MRALRLMLVLLSKDLILASVCAGDMHEALSVAIVRGDSAAAVSALLDHPRLAISRFEKKQLLDLSCQPSVGSGADYTLLMLASIHGRATAVDLLLTHGATVSTTNSRGSTALHGAAFGGHCKVIARLLKGGARLDHADALGATALAWTQRKDACAQIIEEHIKATSQSSATVPDGTASTLSAIISGAAVAFGLAALASLVIATSFETAVPLLKDTDDQRHRGTKEEGSQASSADARFLPSPLDSPSCALERSNMCSSVPIMIRICSELIMRTCPLSRVLL